MLVAKAFDTQEKLYKATDIMQILEECVSDREFYPICKRLAEIPSAVVRCKDCKHLRKSYIKGLYECGRMQVATGLNEFCSRGERNENNREKDTAELLQSGRTKCQII